MPPKPNHVEHRAEALHRARQDQERSAKPSNPEDRDYRTRSSRVLDTLRHHRTRPSGR